MPKSYINISIKPTIYQIFVDPSVVHCYSSKCHVPVILSNLDDRDDRIPPQGEHPLPLLHNRHLSLLFLLHNYHLLSLLLFKGVVAVVRMVICVRHTIPVLSTKGNHLQRIITVQSWRFFSALSLSTDAPNPWMTFQLARKRPNTKRFSTPSTRRSCASWIKSC